MSQIFERFSRGILLLAALIGFGASSFGQDSVSDFANRVDEHYNHIRALRAQFVQEYQGTGLPRSESGTLVLKKPGKMRWEYTSPHSKLFVTDGKTAYFFVPGEQQVRKLEAKKLDDLRSPLAYLLGKTKLEKELAGLSFVSDETPLLMGDRILRGRPTIMSDRITDVVLEVTPQYEINRIVIRENDGSRTEFRFSHLEENVQASDDWFHFRPPAGAEVLEGDTFVP